MPSPSGERPVRIASRGSELALWQARWVQDRLARHTDRAVEIEVIRTTGDRVQDVPLSWIGDRGLFTKEIDGAILDGRADIAVHSLKDVPTRVPDGLRLAAVTQREDPRDVLVTGSGAGTIADLPSGARIGTSSLRRRAQLRRLRPDLEVLDLRGNLNTRMRRLDDGDYDGILLAAAGVLRLGWRERITEWLDPEEWLPAVGQGALAVVVREDDADAEALLDPLHDPDTAAAVGAERAFLASLEGGCQVPIAALARVDGDQLYLDGLVAGLDGETVLRSRREGAVKDAAAIGTALAEELIAEGAAELLAEIRRASGSPPHVPPP